MRTVCYVEPERLDKSSWFARAFAAGWKDSEVSLYRGYINADLHVVWGHRWSSEKIVQEAAARGKHHMIGDNGFWKPDRGTRRGFLRMIVDAPQVRLPQPRKYRRDKALGIELKPWRTDGRDIIVCYPGEHHGLPWKADISGWAAGIEERIRQHTDRPVVHRHKGGFPPQPIQAALHNAWAIVTFGGSSAVLAACEGIPVFCDVSSEAAPIGNLDLSKIDSPQMPDRDTWVNQLAHLQWTHREFAQGRAASVIEELLT